MTSILGRRQHRTLWHATQVQHQIVLPLPPADASFDPREPTAEYMSESDMYRNFDWAIAGGAREPPR